MSPASRLGLTAVLMVLLATAARFAPAADTQITLRTVKYADLMKEVRSHKGKVVVVDVWSTTCPPCMREFPHLVEIREKYGKDGFVAISVSVDRADDKSALARAVKFLEKQKAGDVINLNLDEDEEFWHTKFRTPSVPVVFVFGRDNRLVLKMPVEENGGVQYSVIEEKVKALLAEK
jgi:thiol-disulfide isomerase/thioredoxin